MNKNKNVPKYFILDVDGVFTDGKFYYTENGKVMKRFGPEDNDALTLIKDKLYIHCISGDKRGFPITKRRIQCDMGLPLDLVSTHERVQWLESRFNLDETIYMGDGIFDLLVFQKVAYGIAPQNAFYTTKHYADYITNNTGGEGAVAEACLHILNKFFKTPFTHEILVLKDGSGAWPK